MQASGGPGARDRDPEARTALRVVPPSEAGRRERDDFSHAAISRASRSCPLRNGADEAMTISDCILAPVQEWSWKLR